MSKGRYRGRPLESYSKEELIDLVVMLVTQNQQALRDAIDLTQGLDGVYSVNERD